MLFETSSSHDAQAHKPSIPYDSGPLPPNWLKLNFIYPLDLKILYSKACVWYATKSRQLHLF